MLRQIETLDARPIAGLEMPQAEDLASAMSPDVDEHR